jgi:phage baseplate assembly protein W
MNNRHQFDAIRFPMQIDAGLGQLQLENDYADHVVQLIKQVLFTNPGDRVNRPEFGSGIRRMVFAPNHAASASLTQVAIRQALDKWVGSHIRVEDVKAEAENETLKISIQYTLKIRRERRYLNLEVSL